MENSVLIAPCSWQWQSGVTQNLLQYLPGGGEIPGAFTCMAESTPEDNASGPRSHVESTQTLADFLEKGPSQSPPVDIVEKILAHVQAENPAWLEAYRVEHPASAQEIPAGTAVLEQCKQAAVSTGWSFLGEMVWGGIVEGATHLLDV
jgi:hypothetical protein